MLKLRQTRTTAALVTALTAVAGCANLPPEPVAPAAAPQAALEEALPERVDLATWDQTELYAGWRAEELLDTAVYGPTGEQIGEVENIVVGPDGRVQSIVVESGGFLDIGDTHVRVPWGELRLTRALDRVVVPVSPENIRDYSMVRGVEATEPRAFRVTELIGDYVNLEDRPGYGVVDDLIFDRGGELLAVVVQPDIAFNLGADQDYPVGVPYAFPYYGFGFGFDPGYDYFDLPYASADIAGHEAFDFSLMAPGV